MSYSIKTISVFEKQARRLSRKYPSLKNDLLKLVQSLKEDPLQGTSLGNNCYKIRMAISSKGQGKSGGSRVITHLVVVKKLVYLLSIYDKSEKGDLSSGELKQLLKDIAN
jgi:mRNA-degrading endonuclease RelE of RelBE toxin-antitoxin system